MSIRNCAAIGRDSDTTGAIARAIVEAYYSKDKISNFEDKYMYLMNDSQVEELIKKFHKTIGSNKSKDK